MTQNANPSLSYAEFSFQGFRAKPTIRITVQRGARANEGPTPPLDPGAKVPGGVRIEAP